MKPTHEEAAAKVHDCARCSSLPPDGPRRPPPCRHRACGGRRHGGSGPSRERPARPRPTGPSRAGAPSPARPLSRDGAPGRGEVAPGGAGGRRQARRLRDEPGATRGRHAGGDRLDGHPAAVGQAVLRLGEPRVDPGGLEVHRPDPSGRRPAARRRVQRRLQVPHKRRRLLQRRAPRLPNARRRRLARRPQERRRHRRGLGDPGEDDPERVLCPPEPRPARRRGEADGCGGDRELARLGGHLRCDLVHGPRGSSTSGARAWR